MLPQGYELRRKPNCCHTQDCFISACDGAEVYGSSLLVHA